MSRFDETFPSEGGGPEGLAAEEELQRPRTADGEGDERPFTQAGFREEDPTVSPPGEPPPEPTAFTVKAFVFLNVFDRASLVS